MTMTLDQMIATLRCPRCGHEHTLVAQGVVATLTVGSTVVQVPVRAGVCSYCGEHVFDPVATDTIDAVIRAVRDGDTSHLIPVGQVYRVSEPV
jgi:DNA-directed RNA polymerase subunit RPC12/RpoP